MKAVLAAAALSLLIATSAQAGGKKAEPAVDQQYVQVSMLALPVIVGGVIENYVFVSLRIDLTPKADVVKMREKEPYFRDAIVRAAHRTPFNPAGDLNHVEANRVIAQALRDAQAIAGPGAVKSVQILEQRPKVWKAARKA